MTPKISRWKWGDQVVFISLNLFTNIFVLKINQNRQGGRKFDGLSEYVVVLKKAAYFHENFVKMHIPVIFFQGYIFIKTILSTTGIHRNFSAKMASSVVIRSVLMIMLLSFIHMDSNLRT